MSKLSVVRILASIALAAAWAGQAAAATAGAFQFVAGEVRVILAAGSERPASKGSPVDVGDTIATAKNGMAQIKMGDGAIVVVQPESRVTVAEYHYTGAEDGTERVQFRLEQGGIRALTGAIGHTHKSNYSIETPIAHIGVRGTDHESYYFPAGRDAGVAPGVYNKVNTGGRGSAKPGGLCGLGAGSSQAADRGTGLLQPLDPAQGRPARRDASRG
jgi:hypothetical protein